jgi:FkbM family methyltransferase
MDRIESAISILLAGNDLTLIDVGAAFGLPHNLSALSRLATVCFFEPDPAAARLVEEDLRHRGLTNSHVFAIALSGADGPRTLHVTNVPTGSSLLKPGSAAGLDFTTHDYLFPIREITVETRKLATVLDEAGLPRADAIKLDTQGAELEILKGLGSRLSDSTVAVELEIGFPGIYCDQPGFGDIDKLMTDAGFTLFDLRMSSFDRHHNGDFGYYRREVFDVPDRSTSLTKRITEADGIYFRRKDLVLADSDGAAVRRLVVMQCIYGFFVDALQLLEAAGRDGILSPHEAETCRRVVKNWHAATRDIILDSRWFTAVSAFARRVSRSLQGRLLGQRFYRWTE